MIEKKDWEKVLKDNQDEKEKVLKGFALLVPQFDAMIALAKQEISKFPDDDPMPEDVKNLAKEMTK